MKVILSIIIIVFIFYFGSMRGDVETEKLVTADKVTITRGDYANEYQNLLNFYRQRYGAGLTEDVLRILNPKQRVYDSLVNQAVVLAKADELNLDVSDREVQQAIFSHPAFQRDGFFDPELYDRALRFQGIQPEEYEASQRKSLKIDKLERLIKESVKVSEMEAFELFRLENQKINLSFVRINPDTFEKSLKPSKEDLERYLAEHAETFRIPKRIKLRYLQFPGAAFADSISVTDAMIEDYYHGNLHEFRHPRNETEEGESYLPLDQVRDRIIEAIRTIKGLDEAYRHAKAAHDTIYQTEDFTGYAEEHSLAIKATEFFSPVSLPEELGTVGNLSRWAFDLRAGETTPVLSDERAHYLLQLAGEEQSYIPTLTEVSANVERRWRSDESLTIARLQAENLLEQLRTSEETFESVARSKKLPVQETGFFLPGQDTPEIGYSSELFEALFTLSEKNPLAEKIFFIDGNYHIVQLKAKESIDNADWESEKEKVKAAFLSLKKDQYFTSWLEETKASMAAEGRMILHMTPGDL